MSIPEGLSTFEVVYVKADGTTGKATIKANDVVPHDSYLIFAVTTETGPTKIVQAIAHSTVLEWGEVDQSHLVTVAGTEYKFRDEPDEEKPSLWEGFGMPKVR